MNDNEKLALAKALTANSRRMMELVEANNALVESLVRSLEQSQAVTAIDWSDAPDWAEYAAQDEDGEWWWYEEEPRHAGALWDNLPATKIDRVRGVFPPNSNWRDTLQTRPRFEPAASGVRWDLIPAMYNWIAKDKNIGWYAYEYKPHQSVTTWRSDGGSYDEIDPNDFNIPDIDWRESLMQRPQPSVWDNAPQWANWLAMDKNGRWFWFSDEPECYVRGWRHTKARGVHQHYNGCPLTASDWTKSLQKRPR